MKRTLSVAALVLLAVVALPTAANAAGSDTYGPGSCNSITPASVARGAAVTYSCTEFWTPGEPVAITIASGTASVRTLSTVADAAGDIQVSITTESNPAGTYTLTATQDAVSDSSDFTVLDPADAAAAAAAVDPSAGGKALADTGFAGSTLPWLAGGLVVVGAAALGTVVVRRRQQA